jgi:hypothetical protein
VEGHVSHGARAIEAFLVEGTAYAKASGRRQCGKVCGTWWEAELAT